MLKRHPRTACDSAPTFGLTVRRHLLISAVLLAGLVSRAHPSQAQSNYLSNLSATNDDPLFTTYAAPLHQSRFINDEGYRFLFFETDEGIRFATDHAGETALAFKLGNDVRYTLGQMHAEPVITTSYSDLVKYRFEPFDGVAVQGFFQVYSSGLALQEIRITNERADRVTLDVYPFLCHTEGLQDVQVADDQRHVTFRHTEPLDDWMERMQNQVPYVQERQNVFLLSDTVTASAVYAGRDALFNDLTRGHLRDAVPPEQPAVVAFQKRLALAPGASKRFRLVRGVIGAHDDLESLVAEAHGLRTYEMEQDVRRNEARYRHIPRLAFSDPDREMMYWSAFNLIRQCMMPPEGKSSYNYYVFSREPTWGWGYGGQVFHESLTMLAYVFMDPESAQDAQRVFMQRQWDDGYIPYRVGPYLDETIFTNGDFTSSAPWFSWENWVIYQETHDRSFLEEAYTSGAAFYNWWRTHRDQDQDGLAEWGGHAVLESLRDSEVAVWDEVGWPSNFESLDLNAMLVQEARSLAAMANELGNTEEATFWSQEAEQRAEAIQQTFWDEETGFFYYVDRADHDFTFEHPGDLKRQEIVGFLPLWAGVATPTQAERLVEHLTNPDTFWRPYGVPSLAANDPYYNPTGYWNGPVWVELQYLIVRGLLDYGYDDVARDLVAKVTDQVIYHLKDSHTFWEFYSPEDRWAGYHQTYIWTGLVARMLIDLDRETSR